MKYIFPVGLEKMVASAKEASACREKVG